MRSALQSAKTGLCLAAILMALALPAQARQVTIAWENANNPDIIGFRVYTGPNFASMQQIADLSIDELNFDNNGDWTTVTTVSDTEVEYLVLTAYAADGFESDYSNAKLYNDDDADGVANVYDAFPNDPTETADRDGDGVGDNSDAYPDDPNAWEPDDPTPGVAYPEYRINVGGENYTDPAGNLWLPDTGYVNATEVSSDSGDTNGTSLGPLYETARWDPDGGEEMTFSFPLDAGSYTVRLHFAEKYSLITQPGMRVFSVRIEGQIMLQDYDIFANAGFNTAVVEEVAAQVTDGSLEIEFLHGVQNPTVNAIEVLVQEEPEPESLGTPGRPILVTN